MVPVIVGATGSGKTGLAIDVARELGESGMTVEVISADSRTIYKGMDVGTAKPTLEERCGVKHYGFDLVEPNDRFTAYDWKAFAERKIQEIRARGNVPLVVGGTGLYVDALIYDYGFGEKQDGLYKKVVRDETGEYPDRKKMCSKYRIFGIKWTPSELKERIGRRAEKMFGKELYDETRRLVSKYGWECQAMKSNVYQFAWRYLQGDITLDEAIKLNAIDDWHLAKRQLTWFRRNKNIFWMNLDEIKVAVIKCIQDEQGN